MREVYGGDIDAVDLIPGMFAEDRPEGFAFSDTAFRIFILTASRRLNSDRFFTTYFTDEIYTPEGMQWLRDNTMRTVLAPALPRAGRHRGVTAQRVRLWPRAGAGG